MVTNSIVPPVSDREGGTLHDLPDLAPTVFVYQGGYLPVDRTFYVGPTAPHSPVITRFMCLPACVYIARVVKTNNFVNPFARRRRRRRDCHFRNDDRRAFYFYFYFFPTPCTLGHPTVPQVPDLSYLYRTSDLGQNRFIRELGNDI